MDLILIDEPEGKPRRRGPSMRGRPLPALAIAALGGLGLFGFSFLPYDALSPAVGGSLQVVERMPGERRVTEVDDVLALYRLDPILESYLTVDAEGRILFARDQQPEPAYGK